MKRIEAINAYSILAEVNLAKCDKDTKFNILNIVHELKKINGDFQDFSKEIQESYQKEFKEFETLRDLESRKDSLTEDEKVLCNQLSTKYYQDINEILNQKVMEEIDITISKINKEAFANILESNENLKVAQIDLLMSLICE